MKKTALLLILTILTACMPEIQPQQNQTTNISTKDLVLNEFARLDKELNTSWHEEQLPDNMIKTEAIEPWTAQMLFLKDRISNQNDTISLKLVEARTDMLKSQLAFYLMKEINYTPTDKINCDDFETPAKAMGLLDAAHKSWLNFLKNMDVVLQDAEWRNLIGVDEKRPKFYKTPLHNAPKTINETVNAVKTQCGIEIVIQN